MGGTIKLWLNTMSSIIGETLDGSALYISTFVIEDYVVTKINPSNGQTEWSKIDSEIFPNDNYETVGSNQIRTWFSHLPLTDGGILVAYNWFVETFSSPGYYPRIGTRFGKLDTDGEVVWTNYLPLDFYAEKMSLAHHCTDDSFIFKSEDESFILNVDKNGNFDPFCALSNNLPDLQIYGLNWNHINYQEGEEFEFTFFLHNNVHATTNDDVQIAVYLSNDIQLDNGDTFIDLIIIDEVPFGITEVANNVITLPEVSQSFNHLILSIDPNQQIAEVDKTNNEASIILIIEQNNSDCPDEIPGLQR